jgi:hypothetical protein
VIFCPAHKIDKNIILFTDKPKGKQRAKFITLSVLLILQPRLATVSAGHVYARPFGCLLFGCLACPLCAALPSGHDYHLTCVFAGASSTRSLFGQLIGDHAALTTPAHYAPHISP